MVTRRDIDYVMKYFYNKWDLEESARVNGIENVYNLDKDSLEYIQCTDMWKRYQDQNLIHFWGKMDDGIQEKITVAINEYIREN